MRSRTDSRDTGAGRNATSIHRRATDDALLAQVAQRAASAPQTLAPSEVSHLQRTLGNQQVQRLLGQANPRLRADATLSPHATVIPSGKSNVVQRLKARSVSSEVAKRITLGNEAIRHAKEVLPLGAGNQKEHVQASKGNTSQRVHLMKMGGCIFPPNIRRESMTSITELAAGYFQSGNCGHNADIAFNYLRQHAAGEEINRVSSKQEDHAYAIIGNLEKAKTDGAERRRLVAVDPWPTRPQACPWRHHFDYSRDQGKWPEITVRMIADGQDSNAKYKDKVECLLEPDDLNDTLGEEALAEKLAEKSMFDQKRTTQTDRESLGDQDIYYHERRRKNEGESKHAYRKRRAEGKAALAQMMDEFETRKFKKGS